MSMFQDIAEEQFEKEMLSLLKDFAEPEDFVYDSWRSEKCFDYRKCIQRVVEIAKKAK